MSILSNERIMQAPHGILPWVANYHDYAYAHFSHKQIEEFARRFTLIGSWNALSTRLYIPLTKYALHCFSIRSTYNTIPFRHLKLISKNKFHKIYILIISDDL